MADEMPQAPMAPPMPTPPPKPPAGPTGPATVAPDMAGRQMEARIQMSIVLDGMERVAGLFGGSQTEDGRFVLEHLLKLRKKFGGAEPDLQRSQLKAMGQSIPPVQTPTPQQGQQFQQAAKSMMQRSGVPGAAA